jgi:hypothetical protein
MTPDRDDTGLQALWQSQAGEEFSMPVEQIRKRARRLHARVWTRNLIEYAAGLIVVPSFVTLALHATDPLIRLGAALTALGALFALWQLHRRGSSRRPPDAEAGPSLDFLRGELARQRDAQASVWLWYLAPFAPGMALILVGRWLSPVEKVGRSLESDRTMTAMMAVIMALLFLVSHLANRFGARRLQDQIDELDTMRRG